MNNTKKGKIMNELSQTLPHRIARPGDIFLLLVPSQEELILLREKQQGLRSVYGGKVVNFVHITCERFSPDNGMEESFCIEYLRRNVTALSSFNLITEKLVQFYAPYWGKEVLRWQVKETDNYVQLRHILAASLQETGCSSHFDLDRPTTCTALRLGERINPKHEASFEIPPTLLFKANHVWVSKLIREDEFKILAKIRMEDQSFLGYENINNERD